MDFELEELPAPAPKPAVAPAVGALAPAPSPELDPGVPRPPRPAVPAPQAFDLEADRRRDLVEHRRREDAQVRDAQLAIAARVDREVRVLQAGLALPCVLAVPAGLTLSAAHWPAATLALGAAAALWSLRAWRRWVVAPRDRAEATAAIPPEGWIERPPPGQEAGDGELRRRREALRPINDAIRELQVRRGVAWRQAGAAAAGWGCGAIMPLFTGGAWSHLLVAGAGGAVACAAMTWLGAARDWAVPVVGVAMCAATVLGTLTACAIAGLDVSRHIIYALPTTVMFSLVIGMGIGWWLEHRGDAAPQRTL